MASEPFDDRDGVIWYDGQLRPWRECTLHVLSHGLHFASSVFEGMRSYGGETFSLTEHIERLAQSAQVLDLDLPYTVAELCEATRQVISANDISDGYVRPVAWRGAESVGISAQGTKIHVAIAAFPWPSYFAMEARLKGIRLKTAPWRRPDPRSAPVFTKAAGLYMICTLNKHAVEKEGYDDALMLDLDGKVAECTGANIFLVQNGVIHTPTPACFLNGITRRAVMDLARGRGYELIERVIMPDEFAKTDEVFITGTAAEVTPVSEIDQYSFGVGPVARQLIEDYDALVHRRTPAEGAAAAE